VNGCNDCIFKENYCDNPLFYRCKLTKTKIPNKKEFNTKVLDNCPLPIRKVFTVDLHSYCIRKKVEEI